MWHLLQCLPDAAVPNCCAGSKQKTGLPPFRNERSKTKSDVAGRSRWHRQKEADLIACCTNLADYEAMLPLIVLTRTCVAAASEVTSSVGAPTSGKGKRLSRTPHASKRHDRCTAPARPRQGLPARVQQYTSKYMITPLMIISLAITVRFDAISRRRPPAGTSFKRQRRRRRATD